MNIYSASDKVNSREENVQAALTGAVARDGGRAASACSFQLLLLSPGTARTMTILLPDAVETVATWRWPPLRARS